MKRLIVARPHGFCAGVWHAIGMAEAAVAKYPAPVYCLNELVHNRQVVDGLAARGMRFVRAVGEVPEGAVLLFSAHGVSPAVRAEAAARRLTVLDATCPFVARSHADVRRHAAAGRTVFLIGTPSHDEVVGIAGEAPDAVMPVEDLAAAETVVPPDPGKVAVVAQTTLGRSHVEMVMDVLRRRFPAVHLPPSKGVCYATTNRQEAARRLAREVDLLVVLGSHNSANSNRLAEVAAEEGTPSRLVADDAELAGLDLSEAGTIGLTAGASTPEDTLEAAAAHFGRLGYRRAPDLVVTEETLSFPIPELPDPASS
ncbi:MAG: 4-hydroxy-3-methylbut-2-enyl diphosphate reductase [Kiritimatiellia bacterium]|jgi:4-hydroxy-3-methylbut-2-enyl diphosphate reductase